MVESELLYHDRRMEVRVFVWWLASRSRYCLSAMMCAQVRVAALVHVLLVLWYEGFVARTKIGSFQIWKCHPSCGLCEWLQELSTER